MVTARRLPDFESPPINEVALGVRFRPVPGLTATHFGLYWSQIKDQFGRCEHAAPIAPVEGTTDAATGLPLPRVWLIHNDEEFLIQLQPNLFFLNWRKTDGQRKYPRYATVKPEFERQLFRYFDFLNSIGLARPEPNNCELTYVNIIPKGQGWDSNADIRNIWPDIVWRGSSERFLRAPKALNFRVSFDLPQNAGELIITLQNASRKTDNEPALRLELSARGDLPTPSTKAMDDWFELAHEWIVRGFADATDRGVQDKFWKRLNDAG